MGPGVPPRHPGHRDGGVGPVVLVTAQPGGAETAAAGVGRGVGPSNGAGGHGQRTHRAMGPAASLALPPRTQLNFTVAIDFTASNGERGGREGAARGGGGGRAVPTGAVPQGCRRSPPRCTTPAPTSSAPTPWRSRPSGRSSRTTTATSSSPPTASGPSCRPTARSPTSSPWCALGSGGAPAPRHGAGLGVKAQLPGREGSPWVGEAPGLAASCPAAVGGSRELCPRPERPSCPPEQQRGQPQLQRHRGRARVLPAEPAHRAALRAHQLRPRHQPGGRVSTTGLSPPPQAAR